MSAKSVFDCIEVGMVQELGSHTFEREEIIRFATKFDPQRFHLSEEGARNSNFGRLCASGWHTASQWMRQNIEFGRGELSRLTGQDVGAVFGPSPGVRNIRWHYPVFVGDTVTYRSTVSAKRITPNRPGWGMIMNHSEAFNQDGVKVMSMDGAITIRTE